MSILVKVSLDLDINCTWLDIQNKNYSSLVPFQHTNKNTTICTYEILCLLLTILNLLKRKITKILYSFKLLLLNKWVTDIWNSKVIDFQKNNDTKLWAFRGNFKISISHLYVLLYKRLMHVQRHRETISLLHVVN